ncbi:uncharacterized protein F4822DRAFT_390586 [Hypoxylon trugodes]|uniref:uncharacterized protein n=1 Tax=Hypoxylon trugodes TaxID=326681 RepID=UPI002191234A|nr:uncharacterized protein F4822DRAFT_390586 [Hypoxylon trugodes]KAI1392318.1 hypothetical protein F4822DRAFT_390586 [Hypoxylon trugodes]
MSFHACARLLNNATCIPGLSCGEFFPVYGMGFFYIRLIHQTPHVYFQRLHQAGLCGERLALMSVGYCLLLLLTRDIHGRTDKTTTTRRFF